MAFDKVKYTNDYNRENYDRVNFTMPKGSKERLKKYATLMGYPSVGAYLNILIARDMKEMEEEIEVEEK